MDVFDKSGDGALQINEFVTVDRFRNQLEALAREEKRLAAEAEQEAKKSVQKISLHNFMLQDLNN